MARDDDDDDDRPRKKKKRRGPSDEDKQMAMFCHLGAIIGGIVLPLVLWMTQKEKSRFIDDHGKEAVNFGITMMIGHLVGGFCTCGLLNLILLPIGITFSVMAGMAANRGEDYMYPVCIRFIS
ncbi:MAG: DUF4870 domain-containing protein [Planctomycetes bacterium]|nr:DUF4870 domain-containing protein [Planctomycetota bacterium]